MLTLEQWDSEIAPHLHGIEAGAQMVSRHVGQLVYQPIFDALAADEMAKLEALLTIALDKVRTAQRDFERKPADG